MNADGRKAFIDLVASTQDMATILTSIFPEESEISGYHELAKNFMDAGGMPNAPYIYFLRDIVLRFDTFTPDQLRNISYFVQRLEGGDKITGIIYLKPDDNTSDGSIEYNINAIYHHKKTYDTMIQLLEKITDPSLRELLGAPNLCNSTIAHLVNDRLTCRFGNACTHKQHIERYSHPSKPYNKKTVCKWGDECKDLQHVLFFRHATYGKSPTRKAKPKGPYARGGTRKKHRTRKTRKHRK